jgi:uncharacterized protein (DUF2236 family)
MSFDPQRQQLALRELLVMLVGRRRYVLELGLLTDRDPDAGLFGPGSVTWRVVREPMLLLSGSRALLMQVAHPLVAQGVMDHSQFEANPFDRLVGTVRWVSQFVFGTTAEARRAIQDLHSLHERVAGILSAENATPLFGPTTPYSALASDLATWVYATLVDSTLLAHRSLVGDLCVEEENRFVREWARAGELLDVRPSPPWQSAATLRAYVDGEIGGGVVAPVEASRRAAATVLRPPLPWPPLAPLSAFTAFLTTGLLPPSLRMGYQLRWSTRDQRLLDAVCAALRRSHRYLPRRLRVSPLYDLARCRLAQA